VQKQQQQAKAQAAQAEGQRQAAAQAQAMTEMGLNPQDGKHQIFFRKLDESVAKGAFTEEEAMVMAGQVKGGVAPGTLIDQVIKPALNAIAKKQNAAATETSKRTTLLSTANAEQANGFISAEDLAAVQDAPTSEAAKVALVAARKAEVARKAQAAKDAKDAAKLKPQPGDGTPPVKPTGPANVINAEAPKANQSPAPIAQAAAVQPAASPVVGDTATVSTAAQTESVDSSAGESAVEPAVEGRGNLPVRVRCLDAKSRCTF
jgi:hypothetical protein